MDSPFVPVVYTKPGKNLNRSKAATYIVRGASNLRGHRSLLTALDAPRRLWRKRTRDNNMPCAYLMCALI